jgi:hypothetical protein
MSSSNSSPSHLDPLLEAQRAPRSGQSQSLPSGPPDRDPTAIVDCPELLSLLCQDWTDADKETLLSTFNIVRCEPRSKGEYLPLKNAWGCEDAVAAEAWRRYFDGRTLKDRRIGKKVEVVEMKVTIAWLRVDNPFLSSPLAIRNEARSSRWTDCSDQYPTLDRAKLMKCSTP